ncbi:Protein RTM1 like protein [Verticillium longisporum]|uniref:Protein RTM1 like protein n=1 Tax=Verticillium longisporum TaxID=100787 RepID=A0A0G4KY54_VERLO|nr:Protein RTM1 like protein [Verticillium longisporum]KAG7119407.1 Protein RTM1 like protein [Verticillium longisporum]CRK12098.1 hypothetical protein BN1723_009585 [Verticillium longisporum]CRK14707.1 hypothetical protein BN1708_011231 [Verticillium longisporum]
MAASEDGKDDKTEFVLYRYDPSLAAAVIFALIFLGITGFHTYKLVTTKTWFFVCFVIGGYMQVIGYAGRAVSATQSPDWTTPPYVTQTIFLLISPSLFAASIYMILSRIILVVDGEHCSPIRRVWLTKLFVLGDVLSFLMQSGGGGMMAGGTLDAMHNGERIVILGLIVQIIFFTLFAVTAALFHRRFARSVAARVSASSIPWQRYLTVLYVASGLIMVRSLFRLMEYIQGNAGFLISREVFIYVFDGALMFLTMGVFAWQHPGELNALLEGIPGKHGYRLDSVG